MPITVQHGQTGDFSTLLHLQDAQNARAMAYNQIAQNNKYNKNAYEQRAATAAQSADDAKAALERSVGMDRQATREVNAEYETNRESRSKEAMKWDDELRRRLQARQDAEQQKAFQNKIILSNMQAQQQAQLQEQQARQQEEMQFQKARDKGDITLIPSVQKTMSDLQNRLASINNSPRLTQRQKQEQAAIIKQQLGGIQNNRDNYTQNQNQPMNIENLEKKGYLKKREDGSYEAYNPKNGKFEIVDDPVKKRDAEMAIEMAKLELKKEEIRFNSGVRYSKQEADAQKEINSLEQQIKAANSDIASMFSSPAATTEGGKALINERKTELATLKTQLAEARKAYSDMRTNVAPQVQQGQPTQVPTPVNQPQQRQQVPLPLPQFQTLTKDKDALAVLNWIKKNPQDQRVPGLLRDAKQKGWIQ